MHVKMVNWLAVKNLKVIYIITNAGGGGEGN